MGRNAAEQDQDAKKEVPYLFSPYYEKPHPLTPGAVECLEHSIELAPDRVDGYLALFHLHREEGRTAKARKVGEQLLKRFPDHAQTSEALGDLMLETQEPAKARDFFEKALAANPLVHRLRQAGPRPPEPWPGADANRQARRGPRRVRGGPGPERGPAGAAVVPVGRP